MNPNKSECFVCVAVCSLATSLLKLCKYRDIFSSGWDIFLKFFWHITGMLVHLFQIILNFLYVCQYVSWLTSLLKLDKLRDIFSSGWDIFLKFFVDIPKIFLDYFQMIQNFLYVCQSSSWLTSLLKLGSYRDISSSVGDISLKFFGGFPGMFVY